MIQTRIKLSDASYHDEIYISSSMIDIDEEDMKRSSLGSIVQLFDIVVEKEKDSTYIGYFVRDNRIYAKRYIAI